MRRSHSKSGKAAISSTGGAWWVSPMEKPCVSRSNACMQREIVVKTLEGRDGFDNCPHLQECHLIAAWRARDLEAFGAYLVSEFSVFYLYPRSSDKAEAKTSDTLDNSEIAWISDFLNQKGSEFGKRAWSLGERDFRFIEILCRAANKIARRRIIAQMRSNESTKNLSKLLKPERP